MDSTGAQVVAYTYHAWGRPLTTTGSMASTLGQYNPLRYRGYVYDQETGLYYLQSRYYNPTWGKFINADALVFTGQGLLGNNMFAYCNNPVNMSDPSGNWPILTIATVVLVATIVIPTAINHIVNAVNKDKIDSEINNSYTIEEATKEINEILDDYSPDCSIKFGIPKENGSYIVEITESHNIDSRYDRQKICAIIANTGVTDREFDNISAEWLAHNLASPIPSLYQQAHSVGIDYDRDPRWYVIFPTKILEILGWE